MLQKSISYSEKAFAYKLKNDVLKRKSGRKKSQVDHKTPRKRAIEIAALNETEQKELLVAMEYAQAIPSRSQAQRIRQLSKEKQL